MKSINLKKSRVISILLVACMLLGGVAVQNVQRAKAEAPSTFAIVGASIRVAEDGGLRFQSQISKEEYDALDVVSTGTLVIPKRILGNGTLDLANSDALNIDTTDKYQESEGVYEFRASLVDIPEKNYLSGIVGRSYIQTKDAVYYTEPVERSVSYVANAAVNDTEAYTAEQIASIRQFQKVTADAELDLNFATRKPVANAVPAAMSEGDVLSMEFFLLESADVDMANLAYYNSGIQLAFGVAGRVDDYLGGANGSNVGFTKQGITYTGAAAEYEEGYDGTGYNFAKIFRVGNRIKAEYTYSDGGCSLAVYYMRPADADWIKIVNRTNVAKVSNAVIGLWGTGYVSLQVKELAFKHNGVNLDAVSIDNSLGIEKIFADSEKDVSTTVAFSGAGNYSYGSKNTQTYALSLDYNQTLVWTFDITEAQMAARIEFLVSAGDPMSHPYGGVRNGTAAMLEYPTSGNIDWWGGSAADAGKRNYTNVFRAGWSYKIEYKTESYEGAKDGSLIIYELDDGVYYQHGKVTGLNVASGRCPMDTVVLSIAVISGTATFTMKNQRVYVVETGARVKTAVYNGSVTVS